MTDYVYWPNQLGLGLDLTCCPVFDRRIMSNCRIKCDRLFLASLISKKNMNQILIIAIDTSFQVDHNLVNQVFEGCTIPELLTPTIVWSPVQFSQLVLRKIMGWTYIRLLYVHPSQWSSPSWGLCFLISTCRLSAVSFYELLSILLETNQPTNKPRSSYEGFFVTFHRYGICKLQYLGYLNLILNSCEADIFLICST